MFRQRSRTTGLPHAAPWRNTKAFLSFQKLIEAINTIKTLCALANIRGLVHSEALRGRWWTYGAVQLTVLNPTAERLAKAWEENRLEEYVNKGWDANFVSLLESFSTAPPTSAENDASIVFEIAVDNQPRALMTSDAGAAVLKEVTSNQRYPFLKVSHHGSDTGLDEELVRRFKPFHAAIPVGENPHGHPCIETLDLLRRYGARTYCSSKTNNCRRSCTFEGGNISFPIDKPLRSGWTPIDPTLCWNNPRG
jgi:hypothetical protein